MRGLTEREWWDHLEGDEILNNTAGNPPYDLDPVVDRIVETLDIPHWVDLGCGVGRLTNAVATRAWPYVKIIGIDSAPTLVNIARTNAAPGTRYVIGNGRYFPPLDFAEISGIYSVTVFQHIPHDYKLNYVYQALDLLLPGGKFLFSVSVGDQPDSFNHHQLSLGALSEFAIQIEHMGGTVSVDGPDGNEWTWIEVTK